MGAAGGRATYQLQHGDSANALRQRIQRTATRLGYSVSAYSIRHQFASDAKAAGTDVAELAQAMGQRGTKSTQAYGRAGSGTGGTGLLGVTAEHEARHTQPPEPWSEPGPDTAPEPEPEGPRMG